MNKLLKLTYSDRLRIKIAQNSLDSFLENFPLLHMRIKGKLLRFLEFFSTYLIKNINSGGRF